MFRKCFFEGWDGDIKLVLSKLCCELFSILLCESFGFREGGDGGLLVQGMPEDQMLSSLSSQRCKRLFDIGMSRWECQMDPS
jgi:hypothetical protein